MPSYYVITPLSQRIKSIERELDAQLFHRKARGVELTEAGRVFLDNARATLAQLDHTLETTRRTARGEQGRISVAYTSGAALNLFVARVIREFRDAFPLVSVSLTEGFPPDLVERIRNDRIDVAFIRTSVADPESVVIDPLLEEPMVAALPSGHSLARRKGRGDRALPLKTLAGETFIVFGRPDGTLPLQTSAIIAACHSAGFSPRIEHVVPHHFLTMNLIAAGLGIAVGVQRMNVEGVIYRRLKGAPQLKIPLDLVSRRSDASAAVRQFVKLGEANGKGIFIRMREAPVSLNGELMAGESPVT